MRDFRKDESVNIYGLNVVMQPVLKYAAIIWRKYGQEVVVTSARDGIHSVGSLHYYGYAVDLRTRYFDDHVIPQVAQDLRLELGSDYQVVVEGNHIHVEYDPRR